VAEFFPLRLRSAHMLAPTVRHMSFERADGKPFAFAPGQFLQIHFEQADGHPAKRSYSIATRGHGDAMPIERIEIAVSYVEGGAATHLLAHLDPGQSLKASGPYGRFCLLDGDHNRRYLLVATGTGVTPYRAMLPQLAKLIPQRGLEVALVFGARSEAELIYADEFEDYARRTPGFSFHPCLSRRPRAQPGTNDRAGRVQVALQALRPNPDTDIAYLCGNPLMVDEAFALLKEAGLALHHIRREKYVSAR